jgi:hypothetical protein
MTDILWLVIHYIIQETFSHNFVSSTPRLSGIRTHNVSGDRYWFHVVTTTLSENSEKLEQIVQV